MTTLSFEKALADLEKIVEKMEKGGLSLNESLALFEKGVKLARFLRNELQKAEKKVEVLLKNEKGEIRAEDFELEAEADSQRESAGSPPDKGKDE
jgi:exodeoxyribonuclease VII small subunit